MKRTAILLIIMAIVLWVIFGKIILDHNLPSWFPKDFVKLTKPKSLADFGQAFSLFEGFLSSLALLLSAYAILIQFKQNTDSNLINALSVRQQFLLSECNRLETDIKDHKTKENFDLDLFNNMVAKKQRFLKEAREIDQKLQLLITKIR
jgi:hypothetical protein